MPKVSTRDRILKASLELFNAQGERQVSTNHIAAHLKISPGNLYYHFPNKAAIVLSLFAEYEHKVQKALVRPERSLVLEDKTRYLQALLTLMWEYRFLHRDIEPLLASDNALNTAYHLFAKASVNAAQELYQGFVEAKILNMNAEQVEAISLNAWIILSAWVGFLLTLNPQLEISEEPLKRGIYQVLMLEEGFVASEHIKDFTLMKARFYRPLT